MNNISKKSVTRPWGVFEQFTENQNSTVKIISVKPNEQTSLQYHKDRDELWYILAGDGHVIIGEETHMVSPKEDFFVSRGTRHRIHAGADGLSLLEISYGTFDEDDIVRLDDDYGRVYA